MSTADAGGASVSCGVPLGGLEDVVELFLEVGDPGAVGRPYGLGGVEVGLEVGQVASGSLPVGGGLVEPAGHVVSPFDEAAADRVEPVGDLSLGWPGGARDLTGEIAALGDSGNVDAVVGQDVLEDVAGFGGVGDDAEVVGVASSGRADVQAAVGGGTSDEFVGDVDGVALVAVLGRRVPQPDVLADVLGRQGDRAVSRDMGHDERAVVVDAGDGPPVAVADRLPCGGEELTVVAARDYDITDVSEFTAGDRRGAVGVEVAGVEAGVLDRVVERVDVRVRRRRDRDRLTGTGWR